MAWTGPSGPCSLSPSAPCSASPPRWRSSPSASSGSPKPAIAGSDRRARQDDKVKRGRTYHQFARGTLTVASSSGDELVPVVGHRPADGVRVAVAGRLLPGRAPDLAEDL